MYQRGYQDCFEYSTYFNVIQQAPKSQVDLLALPPCQFGLKLKARAKTAKSTVNMCVNARNRRLKAIWISTQFKHVTKLLNRLSQLHAASPHCSRFCSRALSLSFLWCLSMSWLSPPFSATAHLQESKTWFSTFHHQKIAVLLVLRGPHYPSSLPRLVLASSTASFVYRMLESFSKP